MINFIDQIINRLIIRSVNSHNKHFFYNVMNNSQKEEKEETI